MTGRHRAPFRLRLWHSHGALTYFGWIVGVCVAVVVATLLGGW